VYRDHGVVPKSSRDDNNNKASEDLSAYQLVEPKNLVLNKMKAWQGSVAISDYEGIVSPAYFVYEPVGKQGANYHAQYIHYLLRCPQYISQYLRYSKGIRVNQWDLDPDIFKSLEVLLPSPDEQRTIAAFLDHETARIDRLIEKQQRLIELLKEKRQAVISHAVTKGLDPDVPMKDSGVEWLGQVPEHWVVGPVKYVLHVKKGACKAGPFGSHLTNADMNGSDVKVVTQRNVIDNDMTSGEAFISAEKYEQLKAFTIERGDLLVTTRGTIGRTSLFETDAPAILHPCLIRLQVNEGILNPNWLALIIQESGYVVEQILVNSNATTIEVIYSESLLNVDVAYPPTTGEQEEVLQVISQQRLRYDLLIQKALKLIDALQERRTALISAAVTGKIDVRNWQPNTSTQVAESDLPMAAEQAAEYRV
jgi:type I restriction enzyme S subunit